MLKLELSDVVRKAAMGLGLGVLFSQVDPQAVAAPSATHSQDSEKQDEKKPYKNKITYEQAKKGSKKTKRDYIIGKMYEMGILYHKDHCPDGHVGDVFDFDDKSDKKRLEKRLDEELKFNPALYKAGFEEARESKLAYHCRDPPGQNERLPFIVFYLEEIFPAKGEATSEDEITSRLRYLKASTEYFNTAIFFGKKMPLANASMKFRRDTVGSLYAGYAQLSKIIDNTDKVSDATRQDVLERYLHNYYNCMRCFEIREDETVQEFVKHVVDNINSGMRQLGYVHKYDEIKKEWSLEKE
ncbi:MAG: hypothetical protein QW165_00935 [Candidatus Woesearchaeota archaeon]